jgi:hypothetical protein
MLMDIRRWLIYALEILVLVVGLLTVLQILFGDSMVRLFGMDIIKNIGELFSKFGNAGLIGIVAATIVAWLIVRSRPFEGSR